MKIEDKNGAEFLVITAENDNHQLNPFQINIAEIRYIREYLDDKGKSDGVAIFVGAKMFHTKADIQKSLGFQFDNGIKVKIGSSDFYCVKGSGLSDKQFSFYLINTKKMLYVRKFIPNGSDRSAENNKFAIVTVDERMIQIDKF